MSQIYKFVFPFKGQVKTQLIISKNKLIKPKNVKQFENRVRSLLAVQFPNEYRPIKGHLQCDLYHFTQYKLDDDGYLLPKYKGDLDNIFKVLADCFEPIYKKVTLIDDDGKTLKTNKGNNRFKKVLVTPGVIENDEYISKANLNWVPVENEEDERIEIYLKALSENDLKKGPMYNDDELFQID